MVPPYLVQQSTNINKYFQLQHVQNGRKVAVGSGFSGHSISFKKKVRLLGSHFVSWKQQMNSSSVAWAFLSHACVLVEDLAIGAANISSDQGPQISRSTAERSSAAEFSQHLPTLRTEREQLFRSQRPAPIFRQDSLEWALQ